MSKSIAGRMATAVFLVHLVVLPALYFLLLFLVQQSNEDQFLNYVRGYTRFIADSLERVRADDARADVSDVLDGFMLSGTGTYADVRFDDEIWHGSIENTRAPEGATDDFSIGQDNDGIYNTSMPVHIADRQALLRLGFDEQPIMRQNKAASTQSALILLSYLLVTLVLVALIGRRVTQPIRALREASQEVAAGKLLDRLTVDSDVTEIVELSRDLELMRDKLTGSNRLLQKEIHDRSIAEQERRSLEVQLRHRQRIETVGVLAGGIAHELNNVLVPILLFSEMAMEELPHDSSARDDLQRVVQSATRAKSIVSQVLTFSHQFDDTDLQAVDLVKVLSDSMDLLRPATPPNISLDLDLQPATAIVRANAAMLGQVVVNLVSNACHSMTPNGGTVRISVEMLAADEPVSSYHAVLPAGRYVRLSVTDEGSGIGTDVIDRIFEPFYSTRQVGEGTGLGLSVVHGIVSSFGGGIVVSSELHSGSTFSVYLPFVITTALSDDK